MPQSSNAAYNFAPAENGEKRVELSIDGDRTVIRLSSWVDGLGWCGEKTMYVDPDLLDDMHRMLGAARIRLREQRLDENEGPRAESKVLKFPIGA